MTGLIPPPHVRQNAYLFLSLAVASYFSVAALAAIPILEEDSVNAEAELTLFRDELKAPERQFTPIPYSGSQPFGEIESALLKSKLPAQLRISIVDHINASKFQRQKMMTSHQHSYRRWQNQVIRARQTAAGSARANVDRKGNYERRQYHADTLAWFDESLNNAEREVQECFAALGVVDSVIADWGRVTAIALQQPNPSLKSLTNDDVWNQFAPQCDQYWEFVAPPKRRELGERFGPFKPVAEWLVRTESMSLVGITGLLGFGLLGAAASTIIRESDGKQTQKALVPNLPLVLVRGWTAAVVVFLAIKGGLSVFAEIEADPNPYVLLLTCLVAAVFSEPVWERARQYLLSLTPDRNG